MGEYEDGPFGLVGDDDLVNAYTRYIDPNRYPSRGARLDCYQCSMGDPHSKHQTSEEYFGIDEGVKMKTKEQLDREIASLRAQADQLERVNEQRDKYGEDQFKNGTVMRVDMKYRGSTRSYSYAVIKIAGRYYLTGKMTSLANSAGASGGMTWDTFVAWLAQGDATVWRAKQLEQVL